VLHTKVDEEDQNPQYSPMSLTGPEVELGSEGPIIRNIAGVDAEYRSHPDSSPRPLSPPAPHSLMRWDRVSVCPQEVHRSLSERAIRWRRYLVGSISCSVIYHVDWTASENQAECRFRYIRDQSQSGCIVNQHWSHQRRGGSNGVQHPVYAFSPEFGNRTRDLPVCGVVP
jgi:hypothetical protein